MIMTLYNYHYPLFQLIIHTAVDSVAGEIAAAVAIADDVVAVDVVALRQQSNKLLYHYAIVPIFY